MNHISKAFIPAGLALTLIGVGCRSSQPGIAAPPQYVSTSTPPGQGNAPLLPDPALTPGATLPVTRDDISVPGYTKKVRNVPIDVKRQVYAEYGITQHKPGDYEVDHLISLELGGSNSIKNLWPQSYRTQPWNAHVKDALENEMHDEVCSGKVDLAAAQHDIATDWIAAYKKYFHTDQPLSEAAAGNGRGKRHYGRTYARRQQSSPGEAATPPLDTGGQVWVNLKSGKYFRPGSPYYGHTKQGEYLSVAAAEAQGYVAAKGQ